ncbi:hypothetical protein SPRG_04914 [Saprolegnia parasitica CBS 223.65]|uniref:Uncharacterized protein n=1 Tax=Saprolegnia parasitica (strain CBS 223.65) TaxID=695850 RepID=A0A067CKT6_SAPPC|nr:hypothetical protein SPRG_04914 [Saprolegnia parasitica CBS 223.65]KDO29800.1 hypothetical protein SPRG_04914 [Saprolegnia parasitica CBS 223.65]|eukprot:XP_012199443.1 hypothetical protein SPRG_04914 [Saprolegnia parasitica CBS 223.65]
MVRISLSTEISGAEFIGRNKTLFSNTLFGKTLAGSIRRCVRPMGALVQTQDTLLQSAL